jgi:hypothetical protein
MLYGWRDGPSGKGNWMQRNRRYEKATKTALEELTGRKRRANAVEKKGRPGLRHGLPYFPPHLSPCHSSSSDPRSSAPERTRTLANVTHYFPF